MKLYSVEEMAELLKLSVHTIYAKTSKCNRNHIKADIPPFIKNGKRVLFTEADYEQWLTRQERHNGSQI